MRGRERRANNPEHIMSTSAPTHAHLTGTEPRSERRPAEPATDLGLWIAISGPVIIALSVIAVSWLSRMSF